MAPQVIPVDQQTVLNSYYQQIQLGQVYVQPTGAQTPAKLADILGQVSGSFLPVASAGTLGGIKQGTGLSIANDGTATVSFAGVIPKVVSPTAGHLAVLNADGTLSDGGPVPTGNGVGGGITTTIVPNDTVTSGATSVAPHAIAAVNNVCCRAQISPPAASFFNPPANPTDGQLFSLKDVLGNSPTYNITVTALTGTTINGAAGYVVNEAGAEPTFRYVSTGANWELHGATNAIATVNNLLDYTIQGGYAGVQSAYQRGILHPLPHAITLPAGLSGSFAVALSQATAATSFVLAYVRGGVFTTIAVINFAAGATVGTFSGVTIPTLQAGDLIVLTAPATPDATLADIGVSILGSKQ